LFVPFLENFSFIEKYIMSKEEAYVAYVL